MKNSCYKWAENLYEEGTQVKKMASEIWNTTIIDC